MRGRAREEWRVCMGKWRGLDRAVRWRVLWSALKAGWKAAGEGVKWCREGWRA